MTTRRIVFPSTCQPDRSQNRPIFCGPSWVRPSRVPLRSPHRNASNRVAQEKPNSSGASYRPAPSQLRRASTLPAGGDRIFGPAALFLPLPTFRVRPGPPSRSPDHHAHPFRVAKAKYLGPSLWITWISWVTVGTFSRVGFRAASRLPFRSPPPTSGKCLNPLQ